MSNQIKTVSNLSKGDYIYKKSVNKRAACYAHPCFVSKILLFLGRIIENTCRLILKFISLNFLNVSLPFNTLILLLNKENTIKKSDCIEQSY